MTLYVNWALTLPKFEGNVKACPQYINFLMSERARGFLHVHYFLRLDVQSAFCTSVGGHVQPPGQVAQNHPRTPPEWPCRWDFGPVWAICCRFGPCGNFQPPGQAPPRTHSNCLFDGISAQFGPLAADLARVVIFAITPSGWLFRT